MCVCVKIHFLPVRGEIIDVSCKNHTIHENTVRSKHILQILQLFLHTIITGLQTVKIGHVAVTFRCLCNHAGRQNTLDPQTIITSQHRGKQKLSNY